MRKNRFLIVLLVLAALIIVALAVARLSLRGNENLRSLESRFSIHVAARLSRSQITLPADFNGANWGLKQMLIRQAGYDLTPYAGSTVTLENYLLRERYRWIIPLHLLLMLKDGKVIGAYAAVDNAWGLLPGVFSLPEVGKKD